MEQSVTPHEREYNEQESHPDMRLVRQGWEESFRLMAERGDDHLLDDEVLLLTDGEEKGWQWEQNSPAIFIVAVQISLLSGLSLVRVPELCAVSVGMIGRKHRQSITA